MPTAKKIAEVQELTNKVERTTIAIGADYRGLSVKQMTALRGAMRSADVEVKVVKNNLLKIATDNAGRPEILQIVTGPTAVAFGYGADVVAPAKALTDFLRTSRLDVTIHGAYVEGQVIDRKGVEDLASVPSKEILLSKIAGALISPAAQLAGLLSGTLREFAGLVDARANQLEGAGAPG
ncbi:MAG: 50S ribosomal protein L10 [Dehalococcoidia bacterium]